MTTKSVLFLVKRIKPQRLLSSFSLSTQQHVIKYDNYSSRNSQYRHYSVQGE